MTYVPFPMKANHDEVFAWANEECTGHSFGMMVFNDEWPAKLYAKFEDEHDALMFKLRFGHE